MVTTQTLGRTIGHGAIAGTVAGVVGAAAQYWLVEPAIRAAIALEEAQAKVTEAVDHTHGAGHVHLDEGVVTRAQQVAFGALTTLVVGILVGIAFALVHRYLGPRTTGRGLPASAFALAGLGFVAFALAPAIVIPANPPAVGDPATVNTRTLIYLGTVLLAALLTRAVVAVARAKSLSARQRVAAATVVSCAGLAILTWVVPGGSDAIADEVPAALIWDFRIASLTELALMWLFLAATLAWLSTPAQEREPTLSRSSSAG